jgi:hypothetical protein
MICQDCGMNVEPNEYHPFEYCVLWRAGIDPRQFVERERSRLTPVAADAAAVLSGDDSDSGRRAAEPC